MSPLIGVVIVEGVLILLLIAAGAGLYRRVQELELSVYKGVGRDLSAGESSSLSGLQPGRPAFIVKTNRQCPVCEDIVANIDRIVATIDDGHDVVLVSEDRDFAPNVSERVRVVADPDAWRALQVPYAPALITVDANHIVIATNPLGSVDQLENMTVRSLQLGH